MSYEKQNFEDGAVLKAEHLNHMEEGIGTVADAVAELEVVGGELVESVNNHESRIATLEEGGGSGGGKLYRHSISINYYNPENYNAASGTCYLPPLYSTSDTPINSRDSLLAMVEQFGTASYHDFMCEYNSIVVFNDGLHQHMVYACRISKANWFTLQLFYFDFSASSLYNAPISETSVTQTEFIFTISDSVVEV